MRPQSRKVALGTKATESGFEISPFAGVLPPQAAEHRQRRDSTCAGVDPGVTHCGWGRIGALQAAVPVPLRGEAPVADSPSALRCSLS